MIFMHVIVKEDEKRMNKNVPWGKLRLKTIYRNTHIMAFWLLNHFVSGIVCVGRFSIEPFVSILLLHIGN